MSSPAIQMLEENRLARVMEDIDAGEPIDTCKIGILQAFDLARAGQLFAIDAMKREDLADEQFAAGIRG